MILFVVYLSGFAKPLLENNTDKYLIENSGALPIYALQKKTYSSQFYSQGKIKIVDTLGLKKMIDSNTQFKIIIDHRTLENISSEIKNRLNKKIEHKKRGIYVLKE